MEQEARSSDFFTMFANFMEQPHGMQGTQSNNNNSNPVSVLEPNTVNSNSSNAQNVSMPNSSQVLVATTANSTVNSQILEMGNQSCSAAPASTNMAASDAEMAEIERLRSAFIHPNFPASSCTVSNSRAGDTLMYEGSNNMGIPEEVGNVLDSRIQTYPTNNLDLTQNQAALLEALSSIDKDGFVSLLQQQTQMDSNNLWPMNSGQNNLGNVHFGGNNLKTSNAQSISSTSVSNIIGQQGSRLEPVVSHHEISQSHLMYPTATTKATKHSTRAVPAIQTNQHFVPVDMLQYNQGKLPKNMNDLVLPISKENPRIDNLPNEDRSKEKKLTTTPIPSDADKSSGSCGSSSSGSVSGPEHSPDHVTERTSSGQRSLSQEGSKNSFADMIGKTQGIGEVVMHPPGSTHNMKNYPCYGGVNMLNFGTINFTPVMENPQVMGAELSGEARKIVGNLDMSGPAPTSDSVVEIDETVTSPMENIPMSPSTPTTDQSDTMSPKPKSSHNGRHNPKNVLENGMSYVNMPNTTTCSVGTAPGYNQKTSVKKPESRRPVHGYKQHRIQDPNDNHQATYYRDKTSSEPVSHNARPKEKQRKPRGSKHYRQKNGAQQLDKTANDKTEYRTLDLQASSIISQSIQTVGLSSNIKPKANADPTNKLTPTNVSRGAENIRNTNLAIATPVCRNNLPTSSRYIQSQGEPRPNKFSMKGNPNITNHTHYNSSPKVSTSNPGTKVRQWQTVTAVQVPKLPPVLSEQDRIPKRGRPSKKMMQENLKIKKDTASANTGSAAPQSLPMTHSKSTHQKPPEPTTTSATKLVSMYTINDKGFMEEIAPKLKENRRSKERTQAFLKMLDEIKTASALNPKFGEKAKTGSEKPVKKRSKPRTKVFGRVVTQPLTESGITETMYTFSALAYQYNISNSIVSRATENLLKSAAGKRSKENSSMIAAANAEQQRLISSNNRKGVSLPHCDIKNSTSSKASVPSNKASVPTVRLLPQCSKSLEASSLPNDTIVRKDQVHKVVATAKVSLSSTTHKEVVPKLSTNVMPETTYSETPTVNEEPAPAIEVPPLDDDVVKTDDPEVNVKTKHKKKKHKKHKKHKYSDSKLGSGKKKKKDKERKKKSKKKFKTKLGTGVTPSSSVSVVKPPFQPKQSVTVSQNDIQGVENSTQQAVDAQKSLVVQPSTTSRIPTKKSSFSSGFRQSSQDDANLNTWLSEDHAYDGEDSSSDETNTSPKSYLESSSEKAATTKASNNMMSFAQYSNSTLGFGMFASNQKQATYTEARTVSIPKETKVSENTQDSVFSSSSGLRSKKHHKHKRKKFFRKSKNICDPAILVLLDEIQGRMKSLTLTSATKQNRNVSGRTHANIFFATTISDSPPVSLWTESQGNITFSSQKSDNQAGIVKGTAFKKENYQNGGVGRKLYSKTGEFISSYNKNSKPPLVTNSNTLSVFCSSPFFQKYGYVSKSNTMSSVALLSSTQSTVVNQAVNPGERSTAPCISTNVLSTTPSATEKVQGASNETVKETISKNVSKDTKPEKRKRGWPRGKPRGPRAKKGRPSSADSTGPRRFEFKKNHTHQEEEDTQADANTENGDSARNISVSKRPSIPGKATESSQSTGTSGSSSATQSRETGEDNSSVKTNDGSTKMSEKDVGRIVSESLLLQIKQAIEESLPAHPSVNKDAIKKSVDAAVQSYMASMHKAQSSNSESSVSSSQEINSEKTSGKRSTRSKSSTDNVPESASFSAPPDTPDRVIADNHPKKVWACKHHDTEVLSPSSDSSKDVSKNPSFKFVPIKKKRGPGRPRKYPLQINRPLQKPQHKSQSTTSGLRHGKVPTASATVVPLKRKTGSLAGRALVNSARSGMKRPIGYRRKIPAQLKSSRTPSSEIKSGSSIISKKKAIMSAVAFCTAKSLQSKIKNSIFEEVAEPGLYHGTCVEEHLMDSIDMTVDKYSWDNYKKFEEACRAVDKQLNSTGEIDNASTDSKRRASVPKKSIESVIEKLKSKQAQTMHSAATALLQLREVHSHQRAGLHKAENVTLKKTQNLSTAGNTAAQKRPRGRPRKHALLEEDSESNSSPKRPKVTSPDPRHSKKSKNTSSKENKNKQGKDGKLIKASLTSARPKIVNSSSTPPSKSYLHAGLYSSTFKMDESSSSQTSEMETDEESNLQVQLPPPFDAGLFLRSTQKDFQLPYDVWWMYKHRKILSSQDPSNQYLKITENVYVSPRPVLNLGDHICTCKTDDDGGCGKQCLNRLMYIECLTASCPCGASCSNQVIQKGQWCNSLKRIKTKDRGWGLCSTAAIPEGTFVLEYVGEVLSEAEFRLRTIELYHAYNDHYCVQLDTSMVIDGYRMANEGRYVNHSCEPNCEMQKWCVDGEYRIGLFALREIRPDEELTYDYNFHAYNMNQQQQCRCGSEKCRGFIGGRTQRSPSRDSEVSGDSGSSEGGTQVKQVQTSQDGRTPALKDDDTGVKEFSILQMKPLSSQEQQFIRIRQLFLIRNLAQVRKKEEQQQRELVKQVGRNQSQSKSREAVKTSPKSKSKKRKQNKEEREKLDNALTEMYTAIATCKDQNGVSVAIPFMNLPSKKKNPDYYERISDPIDLSVIERNLVTNSYKDIETFHEHVQRVFKNAEKYHGRKSTLGKDVSRLRKSYANARGVVMLYLNGHQKPGKSMEEAEEDVNEVNENIHRKNEDYIRCICCIYKDEGLMVQCEKCFVWQHCDCMGVKPGNTDRYLCEQCDPRPVSKEVKVIPPPPNTPPGHTYHVTLLRDNMLVKQGDCAYLMRDHRLRHNSNAPSVRVHRNLANIPQEKLDIFRIEKLWTDERGDKYAYGHHFLRPHETHHAPSRTFYHNELFASPFYEIIPLEAVVGLCMVMDLYTYCKGKPKEFKMSDVYICDYRVDKAAGLFTRITKKRYPVCTKPHVFDCYKNKLCPKKNFQPHQVPDQYKKPSSGRPAGASETFDNAKSGQIELQEQLVEHLEDEREVDVEEEGMQEDDDLEGDDDMERCQDGTGRWKKRQRLNGIAHKLLSKLPKQAVDVSYLLEPGSGKRQRKKTLLSLESLSQQK